MLHAPLAVRFGANHSELLMRPQDKRERARKLREIAETRSSVLARALIEQARLLEDAADKQERDERAKQISSPENTQS